MRPALSALLATLCCIAASSSSALEARRPLKMPPAALPATRATGDFTGAAEDEAAALAARLRRPSTIKALDAGVADLFEELAGAAGLGVMWRTNTNARVTNWEHRGTVAEGLERLARENGLFALFDGSRIEVHAGRSLVRAVVGLHGDAAGFRRTAMTMFPWMSERAIRVDARASEAIVTAPQEIVDLIKSVAGDDRPGGVAVVRYGRADVWEKPSPFKP